MTHRRCCRANSYETWVKEIPIKRILAQEYKLAAIDLRAIKIITASRFVDGYHGKAVAAGRLDKDGGHAGLIVWKQSQLPPAFMLTPYCFFIARVRYIVIIWRACNEAGVSDAEPVTSPWDPQRPRKIDRLINGIRQTVIKCTMRCVNYARMVDGGKWCHSAPRMGFMAARKTWACLPPSTFRHSSGWLRRWTRRGCRRALLIHARGRRKDAAVLPQVPTASHDVPMYER